MTVRVTARTASVLDALIACPSPPLDAVEIPDPVVVVEVLSPSTAADDHGVKLDGYFSPPSVRHYLILYRPPGDDLGTGAQARGRSRPACSAKAASASTRPASRRTWRHCSPSREARSEPWEAAACASLRRGVAASARGARAMSPSLQAGALRWRFGSRFRFRGHFV